MAVQTEKCVEALMLYLAVLRAGYVYLPLNTAYQGSEIEYFIGNAEPSVVVCSGKNFGWVSKIAFKEEQEGYDPQKAKDVLDRAGWAKGADGIRSKGGVRASLTYATVSDLLRERVQQVLVDEWKAIGVEVRIQNSPLVLQGSCAGKDPRKLGSFDLVQYASSPGLDPHSVIAARYHSKAIPTAADCAGQNFTRFKSADADRSIEEAAATLDLDQRKAAYARALRLLNGAYVIIWLYDRYDLDARRVELRGWQPNTWQRFTWNAEDWFLKR